MAPYISPGWAPRNFMQTAIGLKHPRSHRKLPQPIALAKTNETSLRLFHVYWQLTFPLFGIPPLHVPILCPSCPYLIWYLDNKCILTKLWEFRDLGCLSLLNIQPLEQSQTHSRVLSKLALTESIPGPGLTSKHCALLFSLPFGHCEQWVAEGKFHSHLK